VKPHLDYDEISRIYDDVRHADIELINRFLQEIAITASTRVLDIGCGTGNHADLLQKVTQAQVFGVDPSDGMLRQARQKNDAITFERGAGEEIPFKSDFFDLVYMIDVIHHVADIDRLFAETQRVLKKGGKACIATQSHEQIEKRPIARFFPETVEVDKKRYPTIHRIVETARGKNLRFVKDETLFAGEPVELGPDFSTLVKKKGYSMLHLISDAAYEMGQRALENALEAGNVISTLSGETLVWFEKGA
jgi:ubiquinone/menaquinone biosynthesis C-methylase UbiE